MDPLDLVIMHATTLPETDAFFMLMHLCREDPRIVVHPSVRWWVTQNAKRILAFIETDEYKQWQQKRLERKP